MALLIIFAAKLLEPAIIVFAILIGGFLRRPALLIGAGVVTGLAYEAVLAQMSYRDFDPLSFVMATLAASIWIGLVFWGAERRRRIQIRDNSAIAVEKSADKTPALSLTHPRKVCESVRGENPLPFVDDLQSATIIMMSNGDTMHDTFNTPQSHVTTHLGRIGRDPARLIAVADYWAEFDAPVELLDDPQARFTEDSHELLKLCLANGIPYRPAGDGQAMAFPVWLLREFYPDNP